MLTVDGWVLAESVESDIDTLMPWFPDGASLKVWGGPDFRHPCNRHSFAEDMHWGRMASFSLRNAGPELAAFGQLYEKLNCIHLARLVVNPALRGQGVGKRLVGMLLAVGPRLFPCRRFSLFVNRNNTPAYECYKSMGFVATDYPDNVPLADVCDYLTRPLSNLETSHAP